MQKRIVILNVFMIMLLVLFILTGCTDKKEEKNAIINNNIETENNETENVISERNNLINTNNELDIKNNNTETNTIIENSNKRSFSEIIKYSEMNNLPYDKKVPDSKLDYLVVYDGFPITEYTQLQKIDFLELNDENNKKYSKTYYTFNKQGLKKKVEGIFGKEEVYEKYSYVGNLSTISISKDFNLIPRDYERVSDLGKNVEKISNYLYDNQYSYIDEIEKIDLNGDNNFIYLVISHREAILEIDVDGANKGTKKNIHIFSYHVFDKEQNYIETLYTLYDDFNDEYQDPNVDIVYADIDNDSKMEIALRIPEWEGPGFVSVYKYDNGKIVGDTNISSAVSP